MRRGRLYLPEETRGAAPGSLEMALTQAFQTEMFAEEGRAFGAR